MNFPVPWAGIAAVLEESKRSYLSPMNLQELLMLEFLVCWMNLDGTTCAKGYTCNP